MAKNELVSLALIYSKPIHGYAINSIIKNMGLEHWARISPASLYNTITRLVKRDCVTVTKEKVGKMPARKVYSITEKGKELFQKELKNAFLSLNMNEHTFYLDLLINY